MKKFYFSRLFFILVLFCFLIVGCNNRLLNDDESKDEIKIEKEDPNNENGNKIGNEEPNDENCDQKDKNKDQNNENKDVVENDKMYLLNGTIWNKGSLIIQFGWNSILLKNYQYFGPSFPNLNGIVTHGNFRIFSYDGEIMKILDFDNNEVTFTVIIDENELIVDRLNSIRWTAPPFEPRFFGQWNGTYIRSE